MTNPQDTQQEAETTEIATAPKLSRRQKQSASMKAKWADKEFKAKMCAAIKAAWDREEEQ